MGKILGNYLSGLQPDPINPASYPASRRFAKIRCIRAT
jgi:hypothetical protein